MNRKTSVFIRLMLILALLSGLWAAAPSSYAATKLINVRDTSLDYSQFTGDYGKFYKLPDSSEALLDYSPADGGATILVFFHNGNYYCENLISAFANAEWASNPKINFIGIESNRGTKEATQSFLSQCDSAGLFKTVYYKPSGMGSSGFFTAYWYKTLVERDGNMDGVYFSYASMGFPLTVVATRGSDGKNYIRYISEGDSNLAALEDALGELNIIPKKAKTTVTVPGNARYDMVQAVFDSVNQHRIANSLPPLTLSGQITEMAMQRAAECAVYYDHTRPNGYSCFSVMDEVGYTGEYLNAENIACGQTSAEEVMNAWMNSPGHRQNILNTSSTQIGIGCFENNGYLSWVQLFGTGSDTTAAGRASVTRDVIVEILDENLSLSLSYESNLSVKKDESVKAPLLYTYNNGLSYRVKVLLLPYIPDVKDAKGNVIATASKGTAGSGQMMVTGKAAGSGQLILKAGPDSALQKAVQLSVTGGGSSYLIGDVNGDGDVNSADLTALARHVAGIEKITDAAALKSADVNNDRDVNSKDLTLLAKFVAGIITSF